MKRHALSLSLLLALVALACPLLGFSAPATPAAPAAQAVKPALAAPVPAAPIPAAPTTAPATSKPVPAAALAQPVSTTSNGPAQPVAASNLPAAVVVWVNGTVRAVTPSMGPRVLTRRSPVYLHDTIISDANSTGEIVFSDQSVLALRGDTVLRIDQYKYDPKKPTSKDVHDVMTLIKGGFRTVTGIIAKSSPDSYQVNTPVATIGVRGTEFAVLYNGQLYVEYTSGTPCVSNQQGSFCMSLNEPYGVVKTSDQAPAATQTKPQQLNDIPTMTTATFSINNSGEIGGAGLGTAVSPAIGGSSPSGSVGSSFGSPSTTPGSSHPVSSFCIQ